ncbi:MULTISPECIES: hypothetical protein [Cysteiniphilum]|uniref:Uncharacterized protein n=1 Tax=Cysteiniphilum litorale TaxID=2056700 RepID=A0A8J2Z1S9_9GAMM|nr:MULTISPECIES: hypothetical protein [Cysteiniphilum]GGF86856.1 hypothetical protein GCM10010995_00220 [Cysteiniphilum litorale]
MNIKNLTKKIGYFGLLNLSLIGSSFANSSVSIYVDPAVADLDATQTQFIVASAYPEVTPPTLIVDTDRVTIDIGYNIMSENSDVANWLKNIRSTCDTDDTNCKAIGSKMSNPTAGLGLYGDLIFTSKDHQHHYICKNVVLGAVKLSYFTATWSLGAKSSLPRKYNETTKDWELTLNCESAQQEVKRITLTGGNSLFKVISVK